MPHGKEKYITIREDIKNSLNRLYDVALNPDAFLLDPHSPEVIRDYDNELSILVTAGEDTSLFIANRDKILEENALKISTQLYEEYKHIVNNMQLSDYPDAFKVMMLYETLTKVYRFEVVYGKRKTFVSKRQMCESIKSHMILNNTTLGILFSDVNKYSRFSDLYFDALEAYNNKIVEKANITLDNVKTYGKGKWIKFEEKNSNPGEYSNNVQRLAYLVKDTQWCTKYLSSTMLSEGDLYVFVDNDNKPHLAVKLSGDEIDEVRGIDKGSAQEIEPDYRDVAISFLQNNESIKYGLEWLSKEEWNKRLIKYNKLIKSGSFTYDLMDMLINDLLDYTKSKYNSSNRSELLSNLHLIVDKLAMYFNCSEEEICLGDAVFEEENYERVPYKIILGDANFSFSKIKDIGDLEIILGNVETYESPLSSLNGIRIILGNADLSYSNINNLGNLEYVGGDLDINEAPLESLSNLKIIGGNAYLSNTNLTDLGDLEAIFKDAYFGNSNIESTNKLNTIIGNVIFNKPIDFSSLHEVSGSIVCDGINYRSLDDLLGSGSRKLVMK